MVQTPLRVRPTVRELVGRIQPRPVEGISALLLPYRADGRPDFDGFAALLDRTTRAGLTPSVNMDTGYVNLLSIEERIEVLRFTRDALAGRPFVASAYVEDQQGELVSLYCREAERVRQHGGTPIMFQSTRLKALPEWEAVAVYRAVAERSGPLIAFELGEMFAPFGWILSDQAFEELIQIPGLIGIKHSSLDREREWARLDLRDRVRPDFRIYTGDDLGVDMIMYGSDYLLGLSTFAPEAFGLRDQWWAEGDARFYMLNDLIQYLGTFAFRPPVPSYKHSAAMFLKLRGRIACSEPHPGSPRRPASDLPILSQIAERLEAYGV